MMFQDTAVVMTTIVDMEDEAMTVITMTEIATEAGADGTMVNINLAVHF